MNTSRVIALVFVSITLSVLATQLFLNSPTPTVQSLEDSTEKLLPLANEKKLADYSDTNISKEAVLPPVQQVTLELQESPNNRYTKLIDEASINALFVDEQGTVDSSAMTHVLTVGMADFIEQASRLQTSSELAVNRQEKLNQQLIILKDLAIYDQHVACSGRICALSLTTNEVTENNRKLLSEFDNNNSFVNSTINSTGEVEFKAIYLHSEDPSKLVMTQP
ncbi:hypothetical protein [Shewanella pealeana]|uniref:Uncharacterized protein n=1 Tax=Shewanella pealeana (strain ATCC 700345 / ANG-SQ1) TaxID=398579 RepID=A8GYF1_SHEPA|nr:hypothetical protein [Shewanella pealeana]ABV85338.1 hypothetical protein Spea_0009 [Shewanella pealeana ATCC 700345]